MADLFRLDLPLIRVPNIDYAASLKNADPDAMAERLTFYPEAPLPVRPGPDFTLTRDIAAVLSC